MRRIILTACAVLFSALSQPALADAMAEAEARWIYRKILQSPHTNTREECRQKIWEAIQGAYFNHPAPTTKTLRALKCIDKNSSITVFPSDMAARTRYTVSANDYIPRHTVRARLEDGVAQVRITHFFAVTPLEFKEFMKSWRMYPTRIVFDVRGNLGGTLDSVTDMLQFFAPNKHSVLYSRTENGMMKVVQVGEGGRIAHIPVEVLVDHDCASACELFAGTLRYWNGAGTRLLGDRTRGKGTIQGVHQHGDVMIRFTTGEYFIGLPPHHIKVDGLGLKPDGPIPKGY